MWQVENNVLIDKIIFVTAHPFAPFKETVEGFEEVPLSDEAVEKVAQKNAAK